MPEATLPLAGTELVMIVQNGQSRKVDVDRLHDLSGSVIYVGANQPASGFTIAGGPVTYSGAFTFALADDLAALEALSTSGIAVRTGTNSWVLRSLDGTAGRISINDIRTGDAIVDLIASGITAGTYGSANTVPRTNFDAYGRATSSNPVAIAIDVTAVSGAVNQTRQLTGSGSVTGGGDLSVNRNFTLVGDEAAPAALRIYATNGAGSRGWQLIDSSYISGGAVPTARTLTTSGSITGGGTLAADRVFTLVGDVAAPGSTQYYGTDAAGTRGWHSFSGDVHYVGLTQPASGLTVAGSPVTFSGTFTLALADDLAAVEGLSTTGLAVRTAANTWTTRTLSAGENVQITNGGGVAGDPVVAVPGGIAFYDRSGTFRGGVGGAIRDFGSTSGVIQLDFSGNNNFKVTAMGALTFTGALNAVSGRGGILEIVEGSAGLAAPAWNSTFRFAEGTAPTISTALSGRDLLTFYISSDNPLRVNVAPGVMSTT